MSLVQLFVPTEVAHDTVAELGELGDVQFKDVSLCFLIFTDYDFLSWLPAESQCQSFPTFLCR
jgi:V-type H+-transporting ATPase subunit a